MMKKIIFGIIIIIVTIGITYASDNTWNGGYRMEIGVAIPINLDESGVIVCVISSFGEENPRFIPTKYNLGWNSFVKNILRPQNNTEDSFNTCPDYKGYGCDDCPEGKFDLNYCKLPVGYGGSYYNNTTWTLLRKMNAATMCNDGTKDYAWMMKICTDTNNDLICD